MEPPVEQETRLDEQKAHLFVQVTPLAERCLQIQAEQQNMSLPAYVQFVLERQARIMNPYALRQLPRAERNQLMAFQPEEAAPLYEADLALPVEQRELTAFTALDGDAVFDQTP